MAVLTRLQRRCVHLDVRLPLWRNWLVYAELPARYADGGFEFSNLGQVVEAAKRGVGLAILDPYRYWLDIPERFRACEKVQIFAKWMRNEAAFDLQGLPNSAHLQRPSRWGRNRGRAGYFFGKPRWVRVCGRSFLCRRLDK